MDPCHHKFHQHQPIVGVNVDATDRFPQWNVQETKKLLAIRAELDRTFMEPKRNKVLWKVVSIIMRDKGFNRSAEQCKYKWKSLVTRYKGSETVEPEVLRQQFPLYDELQAIFAARIQRMLWTEVSGLKKEKAVRLSSEEEEEEGLKKKKKAKNTNVGSSSSGRSTVNDQVIIKEMLDSFMRQQRQMEVQRREAWEARESERRTKEAERRQTMEALERERAEMERRWREREEDRQSREEARAERRDTLITALLNKLNQEDQM